MMVNAHAPTFSFQRSDAEDRLRELILYVAEKCKNDPSFGATKLNKILYYSDFLTYANSGNPITGVEYQALPRGPAPRRLLPIREMLVQNGDAEILHVLTCKGTQKRVVAHRVNRPVFSPQELEVVDHIIAALRGQGADAVSEESHGHAWKCTPEGDSIPYEAIFVSDELPTDEDIAWARSVIRKRRIGKT